MPTYNVCGESFTSLHKAKAKAKELCRERDVVKIRKFVKGSIYLSLIASYHRMPVLRYSHLTEEYTVTEMLYAKPIIGD